MSSATEQIFIINPSQNQESGGQQITDIPGTSTSLDEVEDLSNVCRTCATLTEFLIPIFEGDGLQNNLAEKIHKHLPIQVSRNDRLPRALCCQCASTLLAWHELVQCCVQADSALRDRLASPPDTREQAANEIEENLENDDNRSERSPPAYVAATRPCAFCPTRHAAHQYDAHLVAAHSDLLFHCEECDAYVERSDFIAHMSLHAVQYAAGRRRPPAKRRPRRCRPDAMDEDATARDEQTRVAAARDEVAPPNEFSDRSDSDDGFGPLPESVFEAIEDSQEAQPVTPPAQRAAGAQPRKAKKARTCPTCCKVYTAASSYFYHVKYAHATRRDHACTACTAAFSTRAGLAQHASVHTGERAHECAACDKRFRTAAALYIHAQAHGAAREHRCALCPAAFRWRAALSRHARRHEGSRDHACSTCSRAFSVRADMLRHARTHTHGAHRCVACGQTFAQLRYLKTHAANIHGKRGARGTRGSPAANAPENGDSPT